MTHILRNKNHLCCRQMIFIYLHESQNLIDSDRLGSQYARYAQMSNFDQARTLIPLRTNAAEATV